MKDNKLTTKAYWENYYKENHADRKHIETVCSYYDRFWEIFIGIEGKNKSLIEIGGFPGRYLSYLADKFNVIPTCLDYNSSTEQIENSFSTMNVKDYDLLKKDFTLFEPDKTYDYVMSNGFIEHFENFDAILDKHVCYMHSGSRLLVMIPHMRGYIKLYKYMVDYDNMKIHNLKSMKLEVFKRFSRRNGLKIERLQYFGGFPIGVHQELNFFQKVIYQVHRHLFKYILNPYLLKNPSSLFSSAIIGIFEKP